MTFEVLDLPHMKPGTVYLYSHPKVTQGLYHPLQSEISLSVGHPHPVPLTILCVR